MKNMAGTTQDILPQKIASRSEEITRDFLRLTEEHITDLLSQRIEKRASTRMFAEKLFIAPRHLTNTIRLTLGKSPCDVMEERLTDEAKKMLLDTSQTVAEISYRFGYNDTTNFIKFFKGMAGVTPLQFRKGLMKETKK